LALGLGGALRLVVMRLGMRRAVVARGRVRDPEEVRVFERVLVCVRVTGLLLAWVGP
jgi:hypothetical protein